MILKETTSSYAIKDSVMDSIKAHQNLFTDILADHTHKPLEELIECLRTLRRAVDIRQRDGVPYLRSRRVWKKIQELPSVEAIVLTVKNDTIVEIKVRAFRNVTLK